MFFYLFNPSKCCVGCLCGDNLCIIQQALGLGICISVYLYLCLCIICICGDNLCIIQQFGPWAWALGTTLPPKAVPFCLFEWNSEIFAVVFVLTHFTWPFEFFNLQIFIVCKFRLLRPRTIVWKWKYWREEMMRTGFVRFLRNSLFWNSKLCWRRLSEEEEGQKNNAGALSHIIMVMWWW